MNDDLIDVLNVLYRIEQENLLRSDFDSWSTPEEVAAALPEGHAHRGDFEWVREQLETLWLARKIMQLPQGEPEPSTLRDVVLLGLDRHGNENGRLRLEQNDVRGTDSSPVAQVAIFPKQVAVRFRSRVAELARLLSRNYQRFQMAPSTGLLRYERRPQERPRRPLSIEEIISTWCADIANGQLRIATEEGEIVCTLRQDIQRSALARATKAVMDALCETLGTGRDRLAVFQAASIMATLGGLYSEDFRRDFEAHIVTAGVGSGKSYAFQLGALIHVSYSLLTGGSGLRVLLLYPRVVLAANQFQDLNAIIERVAASLNIALRPPLLDAGGQLTRQMGIDGMETGSLFRAICRAYGSGEFSILVSNLDTLANRIAHPEATYALVKDLDLIVCDEIHLLSGLYGSHARMMLKRLQLLRALWRLRTADPTAPFAELLNRLGQVRRPYIVGASATIAHPARHMARVVETETRHVLILCATDPEKTGWVHHFFLRQKPEGSTMTALVNATACLIHNRRDGLFREYYQQETSDSFAPALLGLDQLPNPIQGGAVRVGLRAPEHVHKTIGFCDSLDGVGRWGDLVADNERTKSTRVTAPNPGGWESYPYFARFQEPLWRVVHQKSFAVQQPQWQRSLRAHYGDLCRKCKKGIRCSIDRVPSSLNAVGREALHELWSLDANSDSYLHRLGIDPAYYAAEWFRPIREAADSDTLTNLDGCAFFQTGLCWWWSMDHIGSNAPTPPSPSSPLNAVKMAGRRNDWRHHFVNAVRLQSITSQKNLDVLALPTINHLFRASANEVFRDREYPAIQEENCVLVIGSPRLEVGVDLSRVMDGITYRAMRDPSSLQQKVGRIGREIASDSVLVHLVTQNARDQYYFRNPHIALDPDYLQALPLHEDNRIVARHHFFMAILDFLALQYKEPDDRGIANDGHRLALINDHARATPFSGWHEKVSAVIQFLFGTHPHQNENLENLYNYLKTLGAEQADLSNPSATADLKSANAPRERDLGAIDVFEHEFGDKFLLTPLTTETGHRVTLAQLASVPYEPPAVQEVATLPRHAALLAELASAAGSPYLRRSYLRDVLCWDLFRRGLPERNIPGNHPFVWTPNFFDAVGTETVVIVEESGARLRPVKFESVSAALALLAPGTVTYRYGDRPCKVFVSRHHAEGQPTLAAPGIQRVALRVDDTEFFEPAANCADIDEADLPQGYFGTAPVKVFTPRQLAIGGSNSQPLVLRSEGMMADNDSRAVPTGAAASDVQEVMTPPRCFPLRWFRVRAEAATLIVPRFRERLLKFAAKGTVPDFPLPPVLAPFSAIDFDNRLAVTDFVWGLDRQYMSRVIDAARLVYRRAGEGVPGPIALGHRFVTQGIVFSVDTSTGSGLAHFLKDIIAHPESVVYQSLLPQVLSAFISEHGQLPLDPNAPWLGGARPSVFAVQNLKSIVLFHLLRRWHPAGGISQRPTTAPVFTIDDLASCFQPGQANYLEAPEFARICATISQIHEPPSLADHTRTLQQTRANFEAASANASALTADYFCTIALDVLLNSLGLALHQAALRLSGAERENLGYFYKQHEGFADLFLFDTDTNGNGTVELVRDNLFIPNAERALVERLRMLGHQMDPLPSNDFARCLDEEFQECASSHAAHLAFHALDPAGIDAWRALRGEFRGERGRAGVLYDFLHDRIGLTSFDHLGVLRDSPEFIAQLGLDYGAPLVGGPEFPVYQALESAAAFCLAGCIGCLLAPETNLHGSLNTKESVNKTLLDAYYRRLVCESGGPACDTCYPASGPARTCDWRDHTRVRASALGRDAGTFSVELVLPTVEGDDTVSLITPCVTDAGDPQPVFRTGWKPAGVPKPTVRVRMEF
jgi:hypothetical protein